MKFATALFMAAYPIALPVASATPTSLQFVTFSDSHVIAILAKGVLPLSGGGVAVYGGETVAGCTVNIVGVESCNQVQAPLLAVLDSSGNQTASLAASALGGGNSIIVSAALDAAGDIWITGETDSDDFPLINALFTLKADYHLTGFIAKLDPGLKIVFSSFLGGQTVPTSAHSSPAAIALDASGNAYIAGSTNDASFPVTGPAFVHPALSEITYAFITKIASDGSKALYSRLLGGSISPCVGGSSCIGRGAYTNASAVAVDASGNATVAGQTYSTDFPVTANVYNTGGGAFVSRISADGSALVWSTVVGMVRESSGTLPPQPSSVESITLDSAANVYIAGSAYGPIAATPGALQSTYQTAPGLFAGAFVLKLSSDATQLLFATNLAGKNGTALTGLALDGAANLWVTGFTTSPDFPGLDVASTRGLDFALELNANGTALQQIFPLIPQTVTQPPAFDSNGNLLLLASAGNLLRMNPATAYSAPAVFALTNSAIPVSAASIAPAEIMTIYGVELGPPIGIEAAPDSNGRYPTELGGVSVQIGGVQGAISAPLLYAGPNQINFEVTPNLFSQTRVTVQTPSGALPTMTVNVAGSLGIFGVANSDSSVNSAGNPAREGSIVSLYLTGLGLPSNGYPTTDGIVTASANSVFIDLVEVNWNYRKVPLPLFYAGPAPGQIDGLDQINVELPAGVQNPVLTVTVPAVYGYTLPATSNAVVVYAQ